MIFHARKHYNSLLISMEPFLYNSPLTGPKPLNVRVYRSLSNMNLLTLPLNAVRSVKLSPVYRRVNCMTMHLPRKVNASNRDTFERYVIRKLRGWQQPFCVRGLANQEKVQRPLG